jgi:hypothetical protein
MLAERQMSLRSWLSTRTLVSPFVKLASYAELYSHSLPITLYFVNLQLVTYSIALELAAIHYY